jgi:hypothetical protein
MSHKNEAKDFFRWFFIWSSLTLWAKILITPGALIYGLCVYVFGEQKV